MPAEPQESSRVPIGYTASCFDHVEARQMDFGLSHYDRGYSEIAHVLVFQVQTLRTQFTLVGQLQQLQVAISPQVDFDLLLEMRTTLRSVRG